MKLQIELDRERVALGEELTGRVVVLEGGEVRSLTLQVGLYEQAPASVVAVFRERAAIREGDLASGEEVPFGYTVSEFAFPSVKGRRCELYWELEAVADRPGLDTVARRRFEVER